MVVPEPVVPVEGSAGGVLASGVVVVGDEVSGPGAVAGGVCCGTSWAIAAPPIAASAAANAMSFIELLLKRLRAQLRVESPNAATRAMLHTPGSAHAGVDQPVVVRSTINAFNCLRSDGLAK